MRLKKSITAHAYCKLNLHLRVCNKRDDGFHNIESVFQLISIYDELEITRTESHATCVINSPRMELPLVNTITKAVDAFRQKTGIQDGFSVHIEKHIPAGAGLGGGSSDAACVLQCLNTMYQTGLQQSVLKELAATIGSDVPFFLEGGTALVQGRGECIKPMLGRSDLFGVLVWPELHSSTATAYQLVSQWKEQGKEHIQWPEIHDLQKIYSGPLKKWSFSNSFFEPLNALYPELGELIASLYEVGACFAAMTGAGTSVFALFESKKEADIAFNTMRLKWNYSFQFLLLAPSQMG